MYLEGPRRMHRVGDLGFTCKPLSGLVQKGYAEFTKRASDRYWSGRLTSVGRREAALLIHQA